MKEMNTQEIYNNIGDVSTKNAVKYIGVIELVVECNMHRYNVGRRLNV